MPYDTDSLELRKIEEEPYNTEEDPEDDSDRLPEEEPDYTTSSSVREPYPR